MRRDAAHDIRTALTSIQGFSELLRDLELSASETHEFADLINREAIRLYGLVMELLDT